MYANVQVQLNKLSKTAIIQKAWQQNKALTLFGCIYDMHTGFLNVLAQYPDDGEVP
ncbi:hypothetical protein D3C75_987810 [compost metagenome]